MTERERELQMARREGYMRGYEDGFGRSTQAFKLTPLGIASEAKAVYPITVTRTRVAREADGRWEWRIADSKVWCRRTDGGDWFVPISANVDLLRGLLANPTEEIAE